MKRFIPCLLALMMILSSLPAALSEEFESLQQLLESFAYGSGEELSFDAIAAALPEAAEPGAVVSHAWDGADGATYTFVYYSGVPAPEASFRQPADDALTAEELLQMVDWVEDQLRTEALESDETVIIMDPAVYQTALPLPAPTADPAVYQTALPLPAPTADPAVYQTALPLLAPTADPAVFYTAQPAPTPTAAPVVSVTACPTALPTPFPAQGNQPVRNATPRPAAQATKTPIASTGDYTTFDSTMQEQKLLNLLNEDRAKNGLPPLTLDPELSRLAQLKSSDMNSNHYFAHESPTYGNASQMLSAFGYDYQGVGENIAHHANVEKAEAAFMSSDGHRSNILGSQWDKVGIGIAYDANGNVYVTQLFAR